MDNKQKKPNIIYILGDDHRFDYLQHRGHPVIKTPHLDALANEGVVFQNAFCTSPVCTPSRTCHYLGQWERKHGVNFNSNTCVSPQAWSKSFPMQLKNNGYFIGWVGKNHVPAGEGGYEGGYFEDVFDYWYGNHGHSEFYPKETKDGAIYENASLDTQVEVFQEGALNFLNPKKDFIESCKHPLPFRPQDKPFCLCITYNLPHDYGTGRMESRPSDDPLYSSTYRDCMEKMPTPETYIPFDKIDTSRLPLEVYNGIYLSEYDYVKNPDALRERQVRICQAVTGIDRALGLLRKELNDIGQADNTIIIFSTDHGIHHGEHGLGGKCFLYDECIRIPLIIYDPRIEKESQGKCINDFALAPDLAPTVLAMAGIEIPDTMQGKSLLPLINGESILWRKAFFTEQLMDIQNYPKSESVREKDWKYIRYFGRTEDPLQIDEIYKGTLDDYKDFLTASIDGVIKPIYEELFDLKNDPHERYNLAEIPDHLDKLVEMRGRLYEAANELRDDGLTVTTLPYASRV